MTPLTRLAHFWLLLALVAGVLGCARKEAPPTQPAVEVKPEVPVVPPDPKQSVKPRTGTPTEMLIGKWESEERGSGLEFGVDGTVKISFYRQLPITGTYKLIEIDMIEWKFPDEEPDRYKFAVTPTSLTLTSTDKEAVKIEFKAVEAYSKELNHPNRQPNEQQGKWIVGTWRGVETKFDDEDIYLYAFYLDGTFSVLVNNRFLHRTNLEMGTYRVHPDANNFIELTYPDTGKKESIYAEISEKELALTARWGFGKELRKHQRVEDKEDRTKPIRADVLTSFALFRECVAAPDKAKEKYAGKPIEVTGSVEGYLTINEKSEIYLLTGRAGRVKCLLDLSDKATADALREITLSSFGGTAGLQVVTVRGTFESITKEEDKAGKIVGGVVGGEPIEKEPVLFVRLSGCKVIARSELKVK